MTRTAAAPRAPTPCQAAPANASVAGRRVAAVGRDCRGNGYLILFNEYQGILVVGRPIGQPVGKASAHIR